MLKQKFKSCCDSCMRTENLALDTKAKRKLKKIVLVKDIEKITLLIAYLFPLCIFTYRSLGLSVFTKIYMMKIS